MIKLNFRTRERDSELPSESPSPSPPERSFRRYKHSLHQALTMFLLVYFVFNRDMGSSLVDTTESKPQLQQQQQREAKLGDGCYHVFLDVGANIGVHGRFLLEPKKYPNIRTKIRKKYRRSVSAVKLFAKEYPELDNRDVCVFAFEANPKHWPRLRQVSEAYAAMGWRYHIVEAAVSDKAGTTTFYHQGQWDAQKEEWGFSGAKDLSEIYGEEKSKGKYTEEVVTIRLSDWIKTHIGDRLVPEVPPSRKSGTTTDSATDAIPSPVFGMKMDIEGFEYVVIPDMIHSGAACLFTFIFGEYHSHFAPIRLFRDQKVDNDNSGFDSFHRVSAESPEELTEYAWALTKTMTAARHCRVRWIDSDDESYLHDGIPLPKPTTTAKAPAN